MKQSMGAIHGKPASLESHHELVQSLAYGTPLCITHQLQGNRLENHIFISNPSDTKTATTPEIQGRLAKIASKLASFFTTFSRINSVCDR
jgi:N-formylglutamate amidohydrolase